MEFTHDITFLAAPSLSYSSDFRSLLVVHAQQMLYLASIYSGYRSNHTMISGQWQRSWVPAIWHITAHDSVGGGFFRVLVNPERHVGIKSNYSVFDDVLW